MSDHALDLLAAMEVELQSQLPLEGGWHSSPHPDRRYPYGTFYITRSKRQPGNGYLHNGIINVWCRHEAGDNHNEAVIEAYTLSAAALEIVDGGWPLTGFRLHDFRADEPRRELQADGLTWRGLVTFSALTSD